MTQYLTAADALFFHQQLIEQYGGSSGVREAGALEFALHRPQTGSFNALSREPAALLEGLLLNHPFLDGNRRVAFAVVDVALRNNDHTIIAGTQAIYDYLITLMEQQTFDVEHLVPRLQSIVEEPASRKLWNRSALLYTR